MAGDILAIGLTVIGACLWLGRYVWPHVAR